MVGILKEYNRKISENYLLSSALCLFLIVSGLVLRTIIPIVILFLYVAVFNKKFTIALLITFPLYDAFFSSGWLTVNKIGMVILLVVFLFNISLNKIRLGKYEWLMMAVTAAITFSYIVGMLNPSMMLLRDEFIVDYLLNTLPKLGFIILFLLTVKSSDSFSVRDMMESAEFFVPFMVLVIAIFSILSMTDIAIQRYMLMNIRPNFFAYFITCTIPFSVRAFFRKDSLPLNAVALLSLFSTAYLVSLTSSRTGLILMALALLLSVILFMEKSYKKIIVLGVLAATGIGVAFMLPQFRYMVSRFADLMGENADTLSVRFRLLETAWELFRNNPILGYGSTKDSIAILIFRETGFPKVSHNAYLDIGLQAGLAGLLAFGALYFNILYDFARKLIARSGQTKWQYPIYLIFLNTLVAGLVLSLNFRDIHIYIIAFAIVLPGLGREKSIDLVMIWKRIVKLRIPIVISMAAALLAGILSGLLIPETAYRSVIEVNATKTQKALTDEFKNYLDEDMQVQFKRHNWFMREFSVKLIATTEVYERVFGSVSATGFWNDFDEFAKGIDIDMRSGNINERLTVVYGEKEASAEVIEKLRNELLLEFENMVMEGIYKEIDFRRDRVEENIEKYKSEKLDDYLESIEYNKAFIARLEIAAEGSYENLVEGNIAIVEKGEGLTKNVPGTGLLTMVLMGLLWIMVIQAVHILRKEEI